MPGATLCESVNNEMIIAAMRKGATIGACCYHTGGDKCRYIRIDVKDKGSFWTEEYNHKLLQHYDRLTHTFCPEHAAAYRKRFHV